MLIIFLLLIVLPVFSQNACDPDFDRLCKDQDRLKCLVANEAKLSENCKLEMQKLTQLSKATGVRGGGGLASFGGVIGNFGLVSGDKTVLNYIGAAAPDSSGFQQHKVNLSTPVWSRDSERISMSLGAGTLHHNQSFFLKDDQVKVPQTLQRIELGGSYTKQLKEKRMLMARASVGSAGDELFYGSRDFIFNANAMYGFPGKEDRYWFTTVFISNNNPLINYIPIPGFIYLYRKGTFTGMFGLPFASIQWAYADPWVLSASFFLSTFNLEVARGTREHLQYYAGFNFGQQTFLRHDRSEDFDRLFLEEKKLFTGLRSPINKLLSSDLQLGHSFDRAFFEGRNFRDRESGEARLKNSWYVQLSVTLAM